MIDLARHVWPALAAALLVGIVFGWRSLGPGLMGVRGGIALAGLVLALCALALCAAFDLVPGRVGLWLDSALLHLAAYLAGCGFGWVVARLRASRRAPSQEVA